MRTRLLPAFGVLAVVNLAHADTLPSPPIKPGLWQLQTEREVDGKPVPGMGDRFKSMSPQARKRMEDAMKQRGIDMSGSSGEMKSCMSQETLSAGAWQAMAPASCKTDFSTRSNTTWKWHTVCTEPPSQTDGEADFTSAEAYSVKSRTISELQGRTRESTVSIHAKRLGSDCGDLKPFLPEQFKQPPGRPPGAKP